MLKKKSYIMIIMILWFSLQLTANHIDHKKKDVIYLNASSLGEPFYSYSFSDPAELDDWKIEGLGEAYIKNEKLVLEPDFQGEMLELYKKGKFSLKNMAKEYGEYLREFIVDRYPHLKTRYSDKKGKFYVNGVFRGGHVNFWCKRKTTENYMIQFDFKSLSPYALHMIMFSAGGLNGEDVFHPTIRKREGPAYEIMYGDIHQYRISYFAPARKTANMRRAPGRMMTVTGPDICSDHPDEVHRCQVVRFNDRVDYFVNDIHVFSYVDDKPLSGGNWGFRVMAIGKGEYDNIKVFDLLKDPISK
jgi:hypothetical protein